MPFKHTLVATDFSESAKKALELAIEISRKFGTRLTLVHCWEPPSYAYGSGLYAPVDTMTPMQEAAASCLQEALVDLKTDIPEAEVLLRTGQAWEEILAAAKQIGADLIVVGTHGRRGLDHVLMGSVAEKVVRMARVPVLTVRGVQGAK
jgi:nucleotide-binding universal stress UspA family protein